jgi:hypothetical protein
MGQADIVVKAYFFEYGKQAPKYSEFPGIVTSETMFGGKSSWANYTSRKESIKGSMEDEENEIGSFAGYTAREGATENSAKQYYTQTDSKKLYTKEDRKLWAEQSKRYFSKEGNLAWTLVVSLQDTSMLEKYCLKDQEDFANITYEAMNKIFKRMHLDPQNMLWWEDYHTNKKNPHMHITFMEKEQTRFRGKLKPKELDMIKTVFTTQLMARKQIFDQYGFTAGDVLKDAHQVKADIVEQADKLPYGTLEHVLNLYSQLPLKGRLQYGSSNMIPFRAELDVIVDEILQTGEIRGKYAEFTSRLNMLTKNINTLNNAEISHLRQTEDNKLRVQLANTVLDNFKNMDSYTAEQLRAWKQDHLTDIVDQVKNNTGRGDLLFDQAVGLMKGRPDASKKAQALQLMQLSANHGNPHAQHVMNYMKKSYGMNRQAYRVLSGTFATHVSKDVRRAISEKTFAIQNEIAAYLEDSDELAPQKIKDQAASKYLEGKRS